MTRALVTQMLEAMEQGYMMTGAHAKYTAAITAAREYLATEPSGELAELIKRLAKQWAELDPADPYRADIGKAADMLEVDAQQGLSPTCPSCQAPGLLYECVHCSANSYPEDFAQQAKRVPLSDGVIAVITDACFQAVADQGTTFLMRAVARAIEAHHGITQGEKK